MESTSYRLPAVTVAYLRALATRWGMTQTQVLCIALDRLAVAEGIHDNHDEHDGRRGAPQSDRVS